MCSLFALKSMLLKDPVIILLENDKVNSDQIYVAGILNECYVNVAQDRASEPISEDIVHHSRIETVTAHIPDPFAFDFSPVTPESIDTFIYKSNSRKATGGDGIPAMKY